MGDHQETLLGWITTLSLLGVVCVVGTIGNLLVVGVYLQHLLWPHIHRRSFQRKFSLFTAQRAECPTNHFDDTSFTEQFSAREMTTPTFFILVLAFVDLIVCCFVVPLSFYLEYIDMAPSTEAWCKTHTFSSVCNIMFSSLLVIAIALDRYFAICHPLKKILTMKRAKVLTVIVASFCCMYGIVSQTVVTMGVSKDSIDNISRCLDSIDLVNVTPTEAFFFHIVQKGNTACFVLSIVVVLILYSLILRAALSAQRRIRSYNNTIFEACRLKRDDPTNPSKITNNLSQKFVRTNPRSNGAIGEPTTRTKRCRFLFRNLPGNALWREIRSAMVLFVVAVVYIIVFTPSLLCANKAYNCTYVEYNMYYLNNMSNPLIYCFMSHSFRRKLKILLWSSCARSNKDFDDSLFSPSGRRERIRHLTSQSE